MCSFVLAESSELGFIFPGGRTAANVHAGVDAPQFGTRSCVQCCVCSGRLCGAHALFGRSNIGGVGSPIMKYATQEICDRDIMGKDV